MSDREVISELVSVVKIDATQAAKEAKEHATRLRALKTAQDSVTTADKAATDASAKLRKELIELKKVEIAGTGDKKALAKQAQEVRLRLMEQAEGARALRREQQALREEQKRLQTEMRETARVAQQTARAEAESIKLLSRAEANAHRERMNFRRLQQSGERINEQTKANAERVRHLGDLGGGRASVANLHRAVTRWRENLPDNMRASVSSGLRAAPGAAIGAGRAAIGAASVVGGGLLGAGAAIASKGAQFESLRTSLETVEGSAQKAAASFKLIQEFAAQTPYSVQEATESLIKLKARGLDASLPSLTAYGDTAAAMGKSLNDVIEAVADATTGEFERLKEFGIKAKSEGDKVSFTFRGTTETVGKNAQDIEKYLQRVGKVNFAGGMERQSKTLAGQLSTLSDTVSQLADTAFQNGLGDALKDIIADMSGASGSADELAKSVGQVLGDAARRAYQGIKDFVGPIDELPGKLKAAADWASSFASGLGSVIKFGTDVVGALGPAETAIVAIGIAATAALGPLGGLFAVGLQIGHAFQLATDSLTGYQNAQTQLQQKRDFALGLLKDITKSFEADRDAVLESNEVEGGRLNAATEADRRYKRARLRALGKTIDQLTPEERADISRRSGDIRRSVRSGETEGELSRGASQGRYSVDERIAQAERAADQSEFSRLQAARKKGKLAPSQQKRLSELATTLDVALPTGGKKGKDHLSAFEQERKSEIDRLVHIAEREAGDQALASGNAGGAAAASRAAGKATRDRLTEQASRGALPGEVERALLREAGFEDAKNTPPPPVIVYQQQFTFTVTIPLEVIAQLQASSADGVAAAVGGSIRTHLERDVFPQTRDAFASGIRR